MRYLPLAAMYAFAFGLAVAVYAGPSPTAAGFVAFCRGILGDG